MKKFVFIVFIASLAVMFVHGSAMSQTEGTTTDQNIAAMLSAVQIQNTTNCHELALTGPTLSADCIISYQARRLRNTDENYNSALTAGNADDITLKSSQTAEAEELNPGYEQGKIAVGDAGTEPRLFLNTKDENRNSLIG